MKKVLKIKTKIRNKWIGKFLYRVKNYGLYKNL